MNNQKGIKFIIFIILIIAFIIEIIVSNNVISVTEETVLYSKLPDSFYEFKILQLSDLHSKKFGKDSERLLNTIDKQLPDIIVMTGDMINTTDSDYNVIYSVATYLSQKYPVYYIVGNHEQSLKKEKLVEVVDHLKELGVTVLDNEKATIELSGTKINLYGMWFNLRYYKDLTNDDTKYYKLGIEQMETILGEANKNEFNIVLTHNPVYFETYSKWGADLTLSGHMHGGMIRLPSIGGIFSPEKDWFPKYDSGVYSIGNNTLIVNRGLGNGTLGFRLFNRPEITAITFRTKK